MNSLRASRICSKSRVRALGLVFSAVVSVVASRAFADEPSDILSDYWTFHYDRSAGEIRAQRLDRAESVPWLRGSDLPGTWIRSLTGVDPDGRFLTTEGDSLVIRLRDAVTIRLPGYNLQTLRSSASGRYVLARTGWRWYSTPPARSYPELLDTTDGRPALGAARSAFVEAIDGLIDYVSGTTTTAWFLADERVLVSGRRWEGNRLVFPLVVFDPGSRTVTAEFVNPEMQGICHRFVEGQRSWYCDTGEFLHELEPETGSILATLRPSEERWDGWLTNGEAAPIAISAIDERLRIETLDFDAGSLRFGAEVAPMGGDFRDASPYVRIPQPPRLAFLSFFLNGLREIVTVDLHSMETSRRVDVDSDDWEYVANIARLGRDWRPPSPPTATPTRTATPTPTQCPPAAVDVSTSPSTVPQGGTFDVTVRIRSTRECTQAVAGTIRGTAPLQLDTGRRYSHPCTSTASSDPEVFSSFAMTCSADGSMCSDITFSLNDRVERQVPEDLKVTCRARVLPSASAGEGELVVDVYEYGHGGRRQPITTAGSVRVAGAPPTPTPTATPSSTPTRTSLPLPPLAPTPCRTCPAIELSPIRTELGGVARFDVRLRRPGRELIAFQTDLVFPRGLIAPDANALQCQGNPFLPQRVRFYRRGCSNGECRVLPALMFRIGPALPGLPEGIPLFTCRARIATTAPLVATDIGIANALGSDAMGTRVPLAAHSAPVRITAPITIE